MMEPPADALSIRQLRRAANRRDVDVYLEAVRASGWKGRLDFGTWERIFYGEWDGQRRKRVIIKVMGE